MLRNSCREINEKHAGFPDDMLRVQHVNGRPVVYMHTSLNNMAHDMMQCHVIYNLVDINVHQIMIHVAIKCIYTYREVLYKVLPYLYERCGRKKRRK